uniref:Uncharacterized protein n=1 Tax=Scleropages formosus TaxID=113540 RepID=A0A8C9SAJ3_SCLFO
MFLHCGRKPEHPAETHADTGRTCKFHTDLSGDRIHILSLYLFLYPALTAYPSLRTCVTALYSSSLTRVSLQTRYWAFVEENIPEWEPFLLGKAPPPNEAKQEGLNHVPSLCSTSTLKVQ